MFVLILILKSVYVLGSGLLNDYEKRDMDIFSVFFSRVKKSPIALFFFKKKKE